MIFSFAGVQVPRLDERSLPVRGAGLPGRVSGASVRRPDQRHPHLGQQRQLRGSPGTGIGKVRKASRLANRASFFLNPSTLIPLGMK